jgi:hypothetical protein
MHYSAPTPVGHDIIGKWACFCSACSGGFAPQYRMVPLKADDRLGDGTGHRSSSFACVK